MFFGLYNFFDNEDTTPILELISHFKREINNSFQIFPELQGVKGTF